MKIYLKMVGLIYIAIFLVACSKKPLHTSKALELVDARPKPGSVEWIDKLHYRDDYKIAYGIFNDDHSLLIRIMARDRSTLAKMFVAGFTVSFDTTGKKSSQFSVVYPMPQGKKNMPDKSFGYDNNRGNRLDKSTNMEFDRRLKTSLNQIEIVGFSDEAVKNAVLNSRYGDGITAWVHLDSTETFYYELKLPINELFHGENLSARSLSIEFRSGDIKTPTGNRPRASMSMSAGGNRGNSGGQRSGRGGGELYRSPHDFQSFSKPINFWVKRIKLQ